MGGPLIPSSGAGFDYRFNAPCGPFLSNQKNKHQLRICREEVLVITKWVRFRRALWPMFQTFSRKNPEFPKIKNAPEMPQKLPQDFVHLTRVKVFISCLSCCLNQFFSRNMVLQKSRYFIFPLYKCFTTLSTGHT